MRLKLGHPIAKVQADHIQVITASANLAHTNHINSGGATFEYLTYLLAEKGNLDNTLTSSLGIHVGIQNARMAAINKIKNETDPSKIPSIVAEFKEIVRKLLPI